MYNLLDYIPYNGQTISDDHKVLAWRKEDGYYFTKYVFCVGGVKVIAMEDN